MLAKLKPHKKPNVYDLVKEAGIDVSNWSDYQRPESPASNPRYCYEWAFWSEEVVVLCLWHREMREENGVIFLAANYRTMELDHRHWGANQRRRALVMDQAIHQSWKRGVPIRVIVVEGPQRDEESKKSSSVTGRLLDVVPWSVTSYDDLSGNARLGRAFQQFDQTVDFPRKALSTRIRKLTRIAYNTERWKKPTGMAGSNEAPDTYNSQNGFGHEEWLFRADWLVDGWRYAFLQGVNKHRETYLGQSLDVTLFTVQPDGRYRLVATINELEVLNPEQSQAVEAIFREKGWIDEMRKEVAEVNGKEGALGDPGWAEDLLNIRFRWENVDFYPADTFLPDDKWTRDRHRYQLYQLRQPEVENIERFTSGRRARADAPEARPLFRRGVGSLEYTPEHHKMQAKLMAELRGQYGHERVSCEGGCIDVTVETENELIYFEIKTDQLPRSVIRQALGQILEYAYYPSSGDRQPDHLVIVGRHALDAHDRAYLATLVEMFRLPLSYRVCQLD